MTDLIDNTIEETIRQLARESMDYIEPICQECWDKGKDDPLGLNTGVNTPINKRINKLVDQIIRENEEADEMWQSELRQEMIDVFYNERRRAYNTSKTGVDNTLECFYCYEERKDNPKELSVRIRDMSESDLFGKSQDEWR
jgi:hypothetical protein